MPPRINPQLSEQEKQQIIARYHQLVQEMNADLPSNIQIRDNERDIIKRINDQGEVTAYRIGLESNAKRLMQDRLLADLKNKYPNEVKTYGFEIARSFKVEDTLEAKAYNENLYQAYIANPDKVAFARYSKVLNFNPNDLLKLKDDKAALAEFYRENPTLCEDALTIGKYIQNNPNVNETVKQYGNAISTMSLALGYPANVCNSTTYDALACPDLTKEQAKALSLNYLMHSSPDVNLAVDYAAMRRIDIPPTELFEEMEIDGVMQNPHNDNMMFRIEPIKYSFNANRGSILTDDIKFDPLTEKAHCTFDEYIYNKDDAEEGVAYDIEFKQKVPSYEINSFNASAKQEIAQEWGRRVFNKIGLEGEMNDKTLENRYKGGILERLGRTTSREYKNLLQASKDYHNPNSSHYLDDTYLKSRAEAYQNHKFAQGYVAPGEEAERGQKVLDGTSLARFNFSQSIIDSIKEKEDILKTVTDNAVREYGFANPVMENNNIIQQDDNFIDNLAKDVNLDHQMENNNNIIENNEIKDNENELDELAK